jgi:DNA (cytosine-5)-methyltransferase 1
MDRYTRLRRVIEILHLGDITKIKGCNAPVVDCIIGGSPCQDLSVAGKRAGLAGERSGLYMEQIRIIKEMRHYDEQHGRTGESIRPRYMVWENVPGAFSSNKGKDFAAVLEEAIKVADPEAPDVPVPEKGWPTSGCIMGDNWSVAWRVLDAQFWGVPQRRRRIALVADFGGQSAPEILFIRKGVSGDIEPGKPKGKETAGYAGAGSYGTVTPVTFEPGIAKREGGHIYEGVSGTLRANAGVNQMAVCYNIGSYHSNAWKSDNPHSGVYEADKSKTLDALQCGYPGCNQGGMAVVEPAYCIGNGQVDQLGLSKKVGTLNCMHDQQAIVIDRAFFNQGQNAQFEPQVYTDGTVPTLIAKGPSDVAVRYIVRRLTPLECERLQGYPDGWTDIGEWVDSKGKKHKEADSPRYKALGNSIAIPPWKWVLKRLCTCYERDATMASLFDGIGGFPYIWEQLNGKGSCLWASEIEEFPMAVTKIRFGGSE